MRCVLQYTTARGDAAPAAQHADGSRRWADPKNSKEYGPLGQRSQSAHYLIRRPAGDGRLQGRAIAYAMRPIQTYTVSLGPLNLVKV